MNRFITIITILAAALLAISFLYAPMPHFRRGIAQYYDYQGTALAARAEYSNGDPVYDSPDDPSLPKFEDVIKTAVRREFKE